MDMNRIAQQNPGLRGAGENAKTEGCPDGFRIDTLLAAF